MIAYVTSQGARIEREGRRLIVRSAEMVHTIFIDKLEQLLLFGNVSITPPAVTLLLKEEIDTVFLRTDGGFKGRLVSTDSSNVFLRKKQFMLTDNEDFCLSVARSIVRAKILNQATLLSRIKRSRAKEEAAQGVKELRYFAGEAEKASSLDELRGLEGMAAKRYFYFYQYGFLQDFGFVKRVRRPPTDPVNAVLSLLYTVLINRCYAAVMQVGLDPQPAVLHSLSYGRNALPLDLVEEFRAPLADALTLSLFNMKLLDWDDFYSPKQELDELPAEDPYTKVLNDPVGTMNSVWVESISDLPGEQLPAEAVEPGKVPLLLQPGSLKIVLTALAKKMETSFMHPIAERNMTYNDAMVFQARQYRRILDGEAENYQPLMLR